MARLLRAPARATWPDPEPGVCYLKDDRWDDFGAPAGAQISRFDVLEASRDFILPSVAELTVEQHRLRQRHDAIRVALASPHHGAEWPRLSALNASVSRRLSDIRRKEHAEVNGLAGTKAQWRALDGEFQSINRGLRTRLAVRRELQRPFEEFASDGTLSRQLLRSFEADGEYAERKRSATIRQSLSLLGTGQTP